MSPEPNIDPATVEGFGLEWSAFDQGELPDEERQRLFDGYFGIFPFGSLPARAEGFDLGCGSGRWAALVAPKVGTLHCIDPAEAALEVARRRLSTFPNVEFHCASADSIPLPDASQDFGYSLGVLHHVPDTRRALADCIRKLKPRAPFLLYLYYDLEDRPAWYRAIWRTSDLLRRGVARMPFPARKAVTSAIASLVYWPLARGALLAERMGADVGNLPLSAYRKASFYTMRTDSLDRFGTRLEQRFSRAQMQSMMEDAGLVDVRFSESAPYWVACGRKAASPVTNRTTRANSAATTSAE